MLIPCVFALIFYRTIFFFNFLGSLFIKNSFCFAAVHSLIPKSSVTWTTSVRHVVVVYVPSGHLTPFLLVLFLSFSVRAAVGPIIIHDHCFLHVLIQKFIQLFPSFIIIIMVSLSAVNISRYPFSCFAVYTV